MIKALLKRIVYGKRSCSSTLCNYLRKTGCSIGEDVTIYEPTKTYIDMTRPWLIEIGNHVKITEGVTILTHGYDWSVLKAVYGEVLGSAGSVKIGDNVFIGMRTTILKGVQIGNNVIIGANSLVNKSVPDNCVVAGNPAKVVMTLDEYYRKRKNAQVAEAREMVTLYRERYGKEPDEHVLREHFWLFSDDPEKLPQCWRDVNALMGNGEFSNSMLKRNKKHFESMKDFLEHI